MMPTSSDGDFLRDHPATYHGKPGADGVSDDATDDHTVNVFAGTQDDRGQLGPVAPLRQERHREGLHEDSEQKIPRAALLVLADDTGFRILDDGGRRFTFQLVAIVLEGGKNMAIRWVFGSRKGTGGTLEALLEAGGFKKKARAKKRESYLDRYTWIINEK